ncbi:diacylglycerol kinase gamma isoform X3 [Monodelphis domestica]|uniref:diacylglycerol kinase gamma isoform X3 n=1 Tax=Monodelphis domestica TaxID=13616 RepID=UPI0024E1BD34|nr:diacylglycerol kinase gamma isoform X3 [Monodelphis domestica]
MSDGLWNSLSPNEFKQLQKYSEYSNYKLKDILEDLYGSEQEISHHLDMPINFEAFKAFMRMYFQEDIPEEFCKHLFLSFKSKNLQQPSKLEISSSVSQVKATFDVSRKPQHGESNTLVTSSLRDLNVPEESGQTTSLISRSKNKSKMFHAPAKSVSFAGSTIIHKTLILNNLEEIGTPTLTENSLLPQSSLDIASQFIYLKDIICYLSLLERGRAEDKLEFMFRLYDTEGNGYLDSTALEQIITQMVHVAEYLEWDTTELRPILKDMLEEIDLDQDGIVTLDEWIEGGMTTIPLLVLLGMETDESKDGMHSWRIKHFTRPAFCHLCRSVLVGVRKQALCCSFCKYTVHESCVFKQVPPCISTYTKSKRDDRVMYHVWMEDNRLVNCDFCKKAIKCYQPGSAVHCVWCHATFFLWMLRTFFLLCPPGLSWVIALLLVHKKCHFKMSVICDGDQLKDHLLLPTSIIPMVLERTIHKKEVIEPEEEEEEEEIILVEPEEEIEIEIIEEQEKEAPPPKMTAAMITAALLKSRTNTSKSSTKLKDEKEENPLFKLFSSSYAINLIQAKSSTSNKSATKLKDKGENQSTETLSSTHDVRIDGRFPSKKNVTIWEEKKEENSTSANIPSTDSSPVIATEEINQSSSTMETSKLEKKISFAPNSKESKVQFKINFMDRDTDSKDEKHGSRGASRSFIAGLSREKLKINLQLDLISKDADNSEVKKTIFSRTVSSTSLDSKGSTTKKLDITDSNTDTLEEKKTLSSERDSSASLGPEKSTVNLKSDTSDKDTDQLEKEQKSEKESVPTSKEFLTSSTNSLQSRTPSKMLNSVIELDNGSTLCYLSRDAFMKSEKVNSTVMDGFGLQIVPPKDTHPLLVFVNPNSGTRQGDRLNFFRGVPNFRVLICGGDGTVSWVLDSLDKINFIEDPKVAILPLGTGNDLSRCLRWGSGYEGGSLTKVLKDIEQSSEVMLDRWQLDITPKGGEDVASYCTFNNYFSIGVDASIAHRFHLMREKYPQKFKSRLKNKLLYFECGTTETFASSCKRLHTFIEVECDGIILNLADTLLESIAVLNISSIYGGSNIWGENKNKSSHSGNKYPLTTQRKTVTDRKKLKSCIQDFSDRRVEVVGLEGTREMGQIYTGLKNAGKRLAQCTSVIIRTSKMLPMQVDGEPWLQGPCTLEITFKNQVHMLARLPPKPSFFFLKK